MSEANANRANYATDARKLVHSGQAGFFDEDVMSETVEINTSIDTVRLHKVAHLKDYLPDLQYHENKFFRTKQGTSGRLGFSHEISDDQVVIADGVRKEGADSAIALVRAGPRAKIVFHPREVRAAIVTCGGLCPGLNVVIAEIVNMLHFNYAVDIIYGIRSGYRGFYEPTLQPYASLTPESVKGIHDLGGTVLGSSRGGFDLEKIMMALILHGITQVYIVGGDGTHRGALRLHEEIKKRGLKIAIVGIPKTIDNDIAIIDRSFGFATAVEEAEKAVKSVYIEAVSTINGVGLVTVMGRHSGFIAAHTTLASGRVDLCMIPEVEFDLDDFLFQVRRAIEFQGHCVVVVAEGAGQHLLDVDPSNKDASGNVKLADIGSFLKCKMKEFFKSKKLEINIKDNDPKYMIRSVKANASDSIYCMILAQNAVHGAMAGYTGFTSGLVNNRTVFIPIRLVTRCSPTFLNPTGRTWERVTRVTHQNECRLPNVMKVPGLESDVQVMCDATRPPVQPSSSLPLAPSFMSRAVRASPP